MIVSLIILVALVGMGSILYLIERRYRRLHPNQDETSEAEATQASADDEQCCGMHITCERDSLLAGVSADIVYYDDEELDALANRAPSEYTEAEVEQLRDVLLTLRPDDIAGWARSIQLRGIELPTEVRDELLLIVAEARASRKTID